MVSGDLREITMVLLGCGKNSKLQNKVMSPENTYCMSRMQVTRDEARVQYHLEIQKHPGYSMPTSASPHAVCSLVSGDGRSER
jgi:hypothetical protein